MRLWAILASLMILMVSGTHAQDWKAGTIAPDFSGKTSAGKAHSLKSLIGKKPTVLYFIGHDCPINATAEVYYQRIATAYSGKVNFVGVIDCDSAKYGEWQATFKPTFPVLLDSKQTIIKRYRALSSPWVVLIDKQGRIQKSWAGYSVSQLKEIGSTVAKSAGAKPVAINTKGAPDRHQIGCSF